MIIHVETHEREARARELDAFFRLRKQVFHDRLRWNVPVTGDQERDPLDDLPCTYTLSLTSDGSVDAGIRLIPTTQTTLLELAFDGLVPQAFDFHSPTIWELSRFCVRDAAILDRRIAGLGTATLALTLANLDYARRNGITHYLTVTDERMVGLAATFGLETELLGRQVMEGRPVVCGLLPINRETIAIAERLRPLMPATRPSGRDAMSHAPEPAARSPAPGTGAPRRR